jgi:hypothetical protein
MLHQERDRTYLRFFSIRIPIIEENQRDMEFDPFWIILEIALSVNRVLCRRQGTPSLSSGLIILSLQLR